MKKIIVTLLVVFSFGICKGQWVVIPDANFAAWLVSKYPTCMRNGNEMDTTCSAIVNATIINCWHANIFVRSNPFNRNK